MIELEIESTGDVIEFPDGTDTDVIRAVAARFAKGRIASAGSAFMQGGGVGTGRTLSGLARIGAAIESSGLTIGPGGAIPVTNPDLVRERLRVRDLPPAEQDARIQRDPLYVAGQSLSEAARETFPTNPRFAGEMFADVLPSSAGHMVPTLAAGMVTPFLAGAQYGPALGQGAAEEAIDAGRPDQAQTAFLATAPIGALSEAALGAAAGIKLLREFSKARGAWRAAGRGAGREALQESIEQVGGNVVASDVAGYDPDRPLLAGVPQAALAGFLFGGVLGGLSGLGQRQAAEETAPPPIDPASDPDLDELPDADLIAPDQSTLTPILEPAPELPTDVDPTAAATVNEGIPAELEASAPPQQQGPAPDQAGQDVPVPEAVGPAIEGSVPSVAAPVVPADVPETDFGNMTQPPPSGPPQTDPPVASVPNPGTPPLPSARISPAAAMQGPPEPSVIQLYGTRALERLDTLHRKLRSNTYSDPALLTLYARVAISIARTLVRGGMALDRAIRQAVAQARQQVPTAPDDDTRLIEAMDRGLNTRQLTEQIDAHPALSDVMRGQLGNRLYVRQPNEDAAAFAGRILDQAGGPDQGILIFRDAGSGLDGATRTALGTLIVRRLADAETQARGAGQQAEADALARRQAEFLDQDLLPYSTDIAQALQAFGMFRFVTPQATIAWARRQLERGVRSARERFGPQVDGLVDQVNGTNATEVDNVAATPEVQDAAGEAIDAAAEEAAGQPDGPLAEAIRIEATNNLDMLESVRRAARQARMRALQNVARASGYWQRVVNTSARQLERRIAQLLNGPTGGTSPDTVSALAARLTAVLGEQLDTALGRQPNPGQRTRPDYLLQLRQLLANNERMSEIWSRVRDAIAQEYPNDPRIAQILAGTFDVWSDALLRRVIDQSLEAQDVTLREMIRANYRMRQGALGERLVRELGMDPQLAQRLVAAADAAYAAEMARVQGTVRARSARIRRDPLLIRALRTGMVDDAPAAEVDRALGQFITERRLRMGRLVRRHYTEVDAEGRSLADRMVAEAGLTGPAAARLAAAVRAQFEARTRAARQREIQRIIDSGTVVPRNVRQAWERIVEMANVGAVSSPAAWGAMQERLGLPRWNADLARRVAALADAIQTAPDGIPQQRAVQALLDTLARENLRWWDLPVALWYANILSGPITHLRNILGNAANLASEAIVSMRRPQDWPAQMAALGRGLAAGVGEAREIMRTGRITGVRSLRAEAARPLELAQLPGALDYMLTPWRLVGRSLAAADTLFFTAAYEQRLALLSRIIARREGLRGEALARRVAEILGRTDILMANARAQATAEGLTGRQLTRRVRDLVDRSLPAQLREDAREYALRATFNNTPYGVLGVIAQGINRMSDQLPALRFIVPFTNVVANVVNSGLNWFPPSGIGRAIWGHLRGRLHGRDVTNMEDLYDQHARAALGTLLMAGLYAAAAAGLDDDDPAFAITAVGPKDPGQRSQLRQQKWIPHSIKVGDRYWSYANTPFAMPLSVLGNWFDALKYGKQLEVGDLFERLAFAAATSAHVIIDQSFLDGVTRILSGLNRNDPKSSAKLFEGLARTATSVVIPNAVRQVDRIFDPTVYDSPDITAALVSSVPFARRRGQPALNVWGEPVTIETMQAFTSRQEPDPILRQLARKGLWLSVPSARTHVDTQPLTPEEVYEYTKARGPRLRMFLSQPEVIDALDRIGDPQVAGELVESFEKAAGEFGAQAVRKYRSRQSVSPAR